MGKKYPQMRKQSFVMQRPTSAQRIEGSLVGSWAVSKIPIIAFLIALEGDSCLSCQTAGSDSGYIRPHRSDDRSIL